MKLEFSAGGVVYKGKKDNILILVGKHSYHHGWVFPKGLIGDKVDNKHQSREETAVREVKEETGIDAKVEKELELVEYEYDLENEKIKKTVYYYTMIATGGDIDDHDDEMEEVEWIDINAVANLLTYASDKKVWIEAQKLIAND